MYTEQRNNYSKHISSLLEDLIKNDILYKKVPVNREYKLSIFGMTFKHDNKVKVYEDYILGAVVKDDEINILNSIIKKYNPHYFICKNSTNGGELLKILEMNYDNEEALKSNFTFNVVDDWFTGILSIYCSKENVDTVNEIIE